MLHYWWLSFIWTARRMHDFQGYFSRTSRTLSFNFQYFPGPKWFSRTFQVLEFSIKKSRTFQQVWEPCMNKIHIMPQFKSVNLVITQRRCTDSLKCEIRDQIKSCFVYICPQYLLLEQVTEQIISNEIILIFIMVCLLSSSAVLYICLLYTSPSPRD